MAGAELDLSWVQPIFWVLTYTYMKGNSHTTFSRMRYLKSPSQPSLCDSIWASHHYSWILRERTTRKWKKSYKFPQAPAQFTVSLTYIAFSGPKKSHTCLDEMTREMNNLSMREVAKNSWPVLI